MKTKFIRLWVEFYDYDRARNELIWYVILMEQRFTGRQMYLKEQIRNKGIHPLSA